MITEARLEAIERDLARAKRSKRRMILMGIGLVLAILALFLADRSMTGIVYGQANLPVDKKIIRAMEFVLQDSQGRTVAMLKTLREQPSLVLYDKGKPSVILEIGSKDTQRLVFTSRKGNSRIALNSKPGESGFAMYDEKGRTRIMLAVTEIGSAIIIYDENGKITWSTPLR